jgi:ABC-2 type transport system ATP-binding protein
MTPVIEVEGLNKTFRSRRRQITAIDDVSLRVDPGSVVAFVGPNGAGKTTTIYALLGLVTPDRGTVRLFGRPAGSIEARRRIGFQSEIFFTYGFKTAQKVLSFYGKLSEMPADKIAEKVPQQIARLGLQQAATRKVRGFSKGMIQRLGLAQALMHEPELLILDEPTTGLDPEGRKMVADIILEEKARGATVFLSSHILSDVERTCDHVVILNQGKVAYSESMATLRSDSDGWIIEATNYSPAAHEAIGPNGAAIHHNDASSQEQNDDHVVIRCRTAEKDLILLQLLQANASIGSVRRDQSLEDLYMRYAGGSSSG